MRIYDLDTEGVRPAKAVRTEGRRGQYYTLRHGESGRGRWQIRWPLASRDFPPGDEYLSLDGADVGIIPLGRDDPRGNPVHLVVRRPDPGDLVLWSLDPGYRGGASYTVEGQAEVLATGYEAQGAAGRMGGADCPVVRVTGPCRLSWTRKGRLYGDPADWVAEFDGTDWTVSPVEECGLEDAALDY